MESLSVFTFWEVIVAVLTVLATVLGIWKVWIRKLYAQLEEKELRSNRQETEIRELRDKLHNLPVIEHERNQYREQRDDAIARNEELARQRIDREQQITKLYAEVVLWQQRFETVDTTNKENVRKGNEWAKRAKQCEVDRRRLHHGLEAAKAERESQLRLLGEAKDREWGERLEQVKEDWHAEVTKLLEDNRLLDVRVGVLNEDLERAGKQIQQLDDQLTHYRELISRVLRSEGRVWEKPLPATAKPFVPLPQRKAPIISVLNLKGGVGKTTLTANIAATLGHPDINIPALVVDLDYQRSLTHLCCTPIQLKQLHEREACIQHLFLRDDESSPPLPRAFVNSLSEVRRLKEEAFKIIACSEDWRNEKVSGTLEDTEMYLFAKWLLRDDGSDLRLRLREALHSDLVQQQFRYIFLDCPPRLSLACINALAASDFVLIPVLLDETSTLSVPLLLRKLARLQQVDGLLRSLTILGVVANKVQYQDKQLVKHMGNAWKRLPALCAEAWGRPVHHFRSMIPQTAVFGEVVSGNGAEFAASKHKAVRDLFKALITEIDARIDHERKVLAAVPQQPPPAVAR